MVETLSGKRMARARKRVCLEDGLRLDLNQLIRERVVVSGGVTSRTTCWQVVGSRKLMGVAVITADLTDLACPRVRIRMRGLDQTIELIAQERPFGGCQWYFRCPVLGLCASVLWKPPGAIRFCSREAWGEQVAYHTQFVGQVRRARIGKERTRSRLGSDQKNPVDRYLPPQKPKWMRWSTFERRLERYNRYEEVLLRDRAAACAKLSAKLGSK
jgi:hypothetical protein